MDKRIKTIRFIKCRIDDTLGGVLVNNKYEIWHDGGVYHREDKDIPSYIYKFRDELVDAFIK